MLAIHDDPLGCWVKPIWPTMIPWGVWVIPILVNHDPLGCWVIRIWPTMIPSGVWVVPILTNQDSLWCWDIHAILANQDLEAKAI